MHKWCFLFYSRFAASSESPDCLLLVNTNPVSSFTSSTIVKIIISLFLSRNSPGSFHIAVPEPNFNNVQCQIFLPHQLSLQQKPVFLLPYRRHSCSNMSYCRFCKNFHWLNEVNFHNRKNHY